VSGVDNAPDGGLMSGLRVGFGFETAALDPARELNLAGVRIADAPGLAADGDGDIACRALLDAVLAAASMPDLRTIFPGDDPELGEAEGLVLLSQAVTALARQQLEAVVNVSLRILQPAGLSLAGERKRMQAALAAALETHPARIAISFGESSAFGGEQAAGKLVVFAFLLASLQEIPAAGKRKSKQQRQLFGPRADADTDEEDATLPPRAQHFERAIKSKLPPLPPAPPPSAGARLIVYTDGASRGNPGPAATGWVVLDEQGRLVGEGGNAIGEHTNNEAEYLAVRDAAVWIEQKLGRDLELEFRSDSELIVKQLRGEWKKKDPELKQLAMEVMNLLMYFASFELKHVPRRENQRADALANRALGSK
jgi:2-C-methyl-D-erythritol 2,4-cyclodiphosphate synthase